MDEIIERPQESAGGSAVHTYWYALAGFALIFAGVFFWGAVQLGIISSPFAVGPNVTLVRAIDQYRAGDYDATIKKLGNQLPISSTDSERWLTAYWLANALTNQGQYEQSIATLKAIADSEAVSPSFRAYAMQEMGVQYYRSSDERVTAAIFHDLPYKALLVATDTPLSYRHLFEYASAFHPHAISQLYIADWYADEILRLLWEEKSGLIAKGGSKQTRAAYRSKVKEALGFADKEINEIEDSGDTNGALLSALARRAVVLGKMERAGYTSFDDPVSAFEDVLARHKALGLTNDGAVRVQYAIFLARKYRSERVDQIQQILSPIYAAADNRSPTVRTIAIGLIGKDTDVRSRYALVATYDPKFKQLLQSFGWTERDFASAQ